MSHAPLGAAAYPPAELDRRFYAFTVDRLVGWGIYAAASYAAWRYLIEPGDVGAGVGAIVATVLMVGLCFSVLLGLVGTSPGKALVGLRVVGASSGAPIGIGRALLRSLILGAASLPTFGIGVATLAWTAVMDRGRQRRGWHDYVSHAVVVDVRPAPVVDEVVEERPRQIVNLTAMRLVPAPAAPPPSTPPRASRPSMPPQPRPAAAPPRPTTPPPVLPPVVPAPVPLAAPPPAAAPEATRVPKLGPPLVAAEPPGPRWRVTFDTGETFVVNGLALVGRRPEARPGETVSHLVPLRSSDMSLSKTHAQFQVTPAGALVVMDRGSTNGSVVIRQGVSKALTAGRPATLLAGDKVRFGDRQMTVEST
ncbi:MAG: RDD family protein [Nocardioides sp.]|nr:RDD family protein [Nocardioides sp.]